MKNYEKYISIFNNVNLVPQFFVFFSIKLAELKKNNLG